MANALGDNTGYTQTIFALHLGKRGKGGDPERIHLFDGRVNGRIVSPRGPQTFGYDAIFQPDGLDKTFAEMATEDKIKISHRTLALQKLVAYIKTLKTAKSEIQEKKEENKAETIEQVKPVENKEEEKAPEHPEKKVEEKTIEKVEQQHLS